MHHIFIMITFKMYATSLFVVVLVFFGHISFAQAQLISNEQVEAQKKEVVQAAMVTIEEQVKLLQMILIQRLEARLAYLQALTENN